MGSTLRFLTMVLMHFVDTIHVLPICSFDRNSIPDIVLNIRYINFDEVQTMLNIK